MELKGTSSRPGTCPDCQSPLDARFYFCPRCARPCRPVEAVLTPQKEAYEDLETRLRVGGHRAWQMFFVFLGGLVISSVLAAAIWGPGNAGARMLFTGPVLAAITLFYLVGSWEVVRPQLGRSGLFEGASWLGLLLLLPLLALNFFYHDWCLEFFQLEEDALQGYFRSRRGAVVMICVMPALFEETAFRGIMQSEFEAAVGVRTAIGLSAFLFALAHFSFLSAPYLMLLGVLLGWLRWRTGSLYPAMVVHFLHNLIVINWG